MPSRTDPSPPAGGTPPTVTAAPATPGSALRQAWVTGAGGFVGGHLAPALRSAGWRVATARVRPGQAPSPRPAKGDVVFHLAAVAHRGAAVGEHMAANCELAVDVYRCAAEAEARAFVFVSTSKVLGDASPVPLGATSPRRPVGAYAQSKAAAEERLLAARRDAGLPLAILRPPLVHGPGAKGNLRSLLWALARGVPLPLALARGQRSLVSVRNLVAALAAIGAAPARSDGIWHVADGERIDCASLCHRLGDHLGRPARLLAVPPGLCSLGLRTVPQMAAQADSLVASAFGALVLDDAGFRRVFDFSPPQTLDAGLAELARWYHSGGRSIW